MIRLWHPVYDPHHCSYRLLALLRSSKELTLQLPKLSFLDLYFLFPHYLHELSLPKKIADMRREMKLPRRKESYVYLPDVRLVYRELQQYQRVALERLVARNILFLDDYENRIARLNTDAIPSELTDLIEKKSDQDERLLSFLVNQITLIPLDGPGGVLRQTKMELGGRL